MLNLALVAALLMPQEAPDSAAAAAQVDAPAKPAARPSGAEVFAELFPTPSGPMTLVSSDAENPLTYQMLIAEYARVTGQHIVMSAETKSMIRQELFLDRDMTIPAAEVQSIFEQLLRHGHFMLKPLTMSGTRIVELLSLQTTARSNLRGSAIFLGPGELHLAKEHPAVLVSATIELPNLDVRQLSNSMRTMITDANTQQLLPAGNSNSMVLVGFGDQVGSLIETLRTTDAAAASSARDAKSVVEIVKLENANALSTADTLTAAYALPKGAQGFAVATFAADARTNSLLITTRAGQLAAIKSHVATLDEKQPGPKERLQDQKKD